MRIVMWSLLKSNQQNELQKFRSTKFNLHIIKKSVEIILPKEKNRICLRYNMKNNAIVKLNRIFASHI